MSRKSIVTLLTIVMGSMLVVSSFLISLDPGLTYSATQLNLIGDEYGLSINPSDVGLFEIDNMLPGDRVEGSFQIENKDGRYPFDLYLKADAGTGDLKLAKQIKFKVEYKDEVIHDGVLADFAKDSIFLGKFDPGDKENLSAKAYLPGEETGNEYQKDSFAVQWTFTAQSKDVKGGGGSGGGGSSNGGGDPSVVEEPPLEQEIIPVDPIIEDPEYVPVVEPPDLPKTGEEIPLALYAAGFIAIVAGLKLLYRKV